MGADTPGGAEMRFGGLIVSAFGTEVSHGALLWSLVGFGRVWAVAAAGAVGSIDDGESPGSGDKKED